MKENNRQISSFEWNRQLFHIFLGILIVLLLLYDGLIGTIIFLLFGISGRNIFNGRNIILVLIIIGLVLSYTSRKIKIPVVYYLLQKFERKKEIERFPGKGIIFYFIGVYIALLLYPKDIAMASIMVLAFGDSISHIFGLHYGKVRHPFSKTKFLEGTIAGFVAGFIGALVFLPWQEAFFASLTAMIVETIDIKIGIEHVDDNLIVPFAAGATVWVMRF